MKKLLQVIIESLVDNPDKIKISEIEGSHTNVLELELDKTDIGKVIGKQGRTADAIRVLLICASVKLKKKYLFQIID